MAVLRRLAGDAALTLATTHHGRLKSLKYDAATEGTFENACVEFDVASMAPTYRLLWGIPGKSNALAIAERLGLQVHATPTSVRMTNPRPPRMATPMPYAHDNSLSRAHDNSMSRAHDRPMSRARDNPMSVRMTTPCPCA